MGMLKDKDKAAVRERLSGMTDPVKIALFTSEIDCEYCPQTRELLEELSTLSERITVEAHDIAVDAELAKGYGIDKAPGFVLLGARDHGIRYYGIPAGYEFASLLEDLVMVSNGDSGLSAETKKALGALTTPVHLQVFVTPTCPYCPAAVRLAHRFALESEMVTADMVEATEFPELSGRYNVMGVPLTVANDVSAAEGALPEAAFLERVMTVAGG